MDPLLVGIRDILSAYVRSSLWNRKIEIGLNISSRISSSPLMFSMDYRNVYVIYYVYGRESNLHNFPQ